MRILDNFFDRHRLPRRCRSRCTPWQNHLLLAVTLLACSLTLAFVARAATDKGSADLELLAQWSLNHGSYLIDVGKYLEALEAFDTSFESSANATTKVRALLHRAMTLATFLDAPEGALKVYRRIEKDFPDHAETGRYRESLLLFDIERYKQAASTLTAYLRDYPAGRFRFQAEAILEQAQAHIKAGAPPIEVPEVPPRKPKQEKPVTVPEKPEPPSDEVKPVARLPVVRVLLYRKTKEVRLEGKDMVLLSGNTKLWQGNKVTLRAKGGKVDVPGKGRVGAEVTLQAQGPRECSGEWR